MPIANIDFTLYTKDAWFKCYPDSNEEEWIQTTQPNNLKLYLCTIYTQIEKLVEKNPDLSYRIITIDDEYFEYLNAHNIENTSQNRIEYIKQVTDEDALRLYIKHKDEFMSYKVAGMPITLYSKELYPTDKAINTELPEELRKKIERYLEQFYGEKNVYVPQYLLKPSTILTDYERFYSLADDYLENNRKIKLGIYGTQTIKKGTNITRLYIPIYFRIVPTTMRFTKDTIFNPQLNELRIFPEYSIYITDVLQEFSTNVKGIKDLDFDNDITKFLQKEGEAILSPYLILYDDILEQEQLFITEMRKSLKKAHIGFKVKKER